jgi:hypothetical protein
MARLRFVKRLAEARQGLKARLYAELGALLQRDLSPDELQRAQNLFFRLDVLEKEEGDAALERFLNGLPDGVALLICQELGRMLDTEVSPGRGETAGA